MGYPVVFDTPNGRIGGWRADPPAHSAVDAPVDSAAAAAGRAGRPILGRLIVVQEIFGVNAHIRAVVDRFAEHGFTAVAPALFDHFEQHVQLGYDEAGVARGRELVAQLGFERAIEDLRAVQLRLDCEGAVGVVGFCWGGTAAFLANTRLGLPAVSYYGGRTTPFVGEKLGAPMMLHYGERDPIIPADQRTAQIAAYPDAEAHVYPAGHGFNCDARADYAPESAALAWQRTLAFFAKHLS